MGLDLVEFIVEVEDAFGLEISNDVAAGLLTPGALVDHLESRLVQTTQVGCPEREARHPKSAADASRYLSRRAAVTDSASRQWTRKTIETRVTELLADVLGVREFDWDDRFVRDLGVD